MAAKGKKTADKIKGELKGLGKKVADGSKRLYSLAELSAKKAKLENENDKAFRQIGSLAYNKGGLTGKAAKLGEGVKANKAEIKKLNAKIKKAKEKK